MTKIILGLIGFLLFTVVLYAAPTHIVKRKAEESQPAPKPAHAVPRGKVAENPAPKFHLGSGGKPRLGAVATGGTFNVQRVGVSVDASGTTLILIDYLNAANMSVHTRSIISPPCGVQAPVVDQFGTQLASKQPAALCSAVGAFITQIDGLIEGAATGGKLAL
jgi:hypothetical protein